MINEITDSCTQKMQASIEHMHRDFKTLRTGKVLISVLDNVKIDYYGTPTPLDQIGSVIATDATTIVINPWEKNLLSDLESAIFAANIGVSPNSDGDVIKLFFPPMTVDQRKESVKQMKGMGENAKVSIRNDRRDANDKVKKLEKEVIANPSNAEFWDNYDAIYETYKGAVIKINQFEEYGDQLQLDSNQLMSKFVNLRDEISENCDGKWQIGIIRKYCNNGNDQFLQFCKQFDK